MEKNCLVTTYKATVNDNSLLKVGEMFIDIIEQASPTSQTNRLYLNTNNVDDLVVEVEDGAANLTLDEEMASGWTNKITLPKSFSPAPIFVRNGNYRVKVFSKYNLYELGKYTTSINQRAISVDTKYLKYSHNLLTLLACLSGNLANISECTKLRRLWDLTNSSNIEGSLSDLSPLTTLISIKFSSSKLTGSLSDLAPLTALTNIELEGCKNITGSLSDLAPLTALTSINLGGCKNITGTINDLTQPLTKISVYNTQVTGELIEFVKTQRSAGRTTGSCTSTWWGDKITFNGVVISASQPSLSWTENTITLGDITVEQ